MRFARTWFVVSAIALLIVLVAVALVRREPPRSGAADVLQQTPESADSAVLRGQRPDAHEGAVSPDDSQNPGTTAETAVLLSGKVWDEWHKPVTVGHVAVDEIRSGVSGDLRVAAIPLSESGRFSATVGVQTESRLSLYLERSPGLRSVLKILGDPLDDSYDLVLVAYRTARVAVRVIDDLGSPVEAARITATPTSILPQPVETDASGGATVELRADPISALQAEDAGGRVGRTKALYLQPGEQRQLTIRLDEHWEPHSVRCNSSRFPELVGRPARIRFGPGLTTWVPVQIGNAGETIRLPRRGVKFASLDVEGYGLVTFHRERLAAAGYPGLELDFDIGSRASLALQLVDPSGSPCGHLQVTVRGPEDETATHVGMTDRTGIVTFASLESGLYAVRSGQSELGTVEVALACTEARLTVPDVSSVGGSYVGPTRVGGGPVALVMASDDGVLFRGSLGAILTGDEWRVSVPVPVGSSLEFSVVVGREQILTSQAVLAGASGIRVDVSGHILTLRVVAGDRQQVQGWLHLRPTEGGSSGVRAFSIDPVEGTVTIPRTSTTSYVVFYSTDAWGQIGVTAPLELHVEPAVREYVIDIAR